MQSKFRIGDIFLLKPHGLWGFLLRTFTDEQYQHAGIVYGLIEGRVFIAESLYNGVNLTPLDTYKENSYHIYRLNGVINESELTTSIINSVRIGYDYAGLLGASLTELKIIAKNTLQNNSLYYCSEFVAKILNLENIKTPSDLASSKFTRRIF